MPRNIYPDRWFFWAIAFMLIVTFILLYNTVETIKVLDDLALSMAQPYVSPWKNFVSQDLGISLRYPSSWQVEFDPQEAFSISFQNPANYNENIYIAVPEPKYESTIRKSLDIQNEHPIVLDGHTGVWLTSANAEDVAITNVLLFKIDDRLYYIAGNAEIFEKVIASIKFIQ